MDQDDPSDGSRLALALSYYYCRWIQTIHPTATEVGTTSRWAHVENSVQHRIGAIAA
jgi:hypothetical protein